MDQTSPIKILSCSSMNGKSNEEESDRVYLKKQLGLIDAIGIIIGVIVGSGIFVSSKSVLQYSGSIGFGLVIWIFTGMLSMVGALCYAELATMIMKSGGDYAYLNEAYGPSVAFLYMWSAFFVLMPASHAISSITFANYLLKPMWGECNPPFVAIRLVAALVICFLTFLNCLEVKLVSKIRNVLSIGKILALVLIISCGTWALTSGRYNNLRDPFEGTNFQPGYVALSFYSGLFSFSGWSYLNFVTEELQNPFKCIPRAISISLPVVTIIYALVNMSYYIVLTRDEILSSEAVAVTFGAKIHSCFQWVIPAFVVSSTFGSLSSSIFTYSRLFFVGARYGHLPKAVAFIHVKKYTPVPSLIIMCFLTVILLLIKDIETLINYATFVESLFSMFSILGLLLLRYTAPKMERPIKVNIILPIIYLLVAMLLVTLPFFEEPVSVGAGLIIILSGVIAYFVFIQHCNQCKLLNNVIESFNILCEKLFLCIPEETEYD